MPPSDLELSLVLPAYKEAENLDILLPRLAEALGAMQAGYEIIVVDTMEPMDHTGEICARHGAKYINRSGGNNYGDAIRTGIQSSGGGYVLFMDGDGSHSPNDVPRLWEKRAPGRIVVASRYVAGGDTENPAHLIWMSWLVNRIYSLVLGIRCRDVSNSFKLYPGPALRGLRITCNNFDVVEEILYKMVRARRDLEIVEIPSTFKKRMFGETKRNLLVFMATYLFSLFKLRFRG